MSQGMVEMRLRGALRPGSPKPARKSSVKSLKMEQLGIFETGADEEKFGVAAGIGMSINGSRSSRSFFTQPTHECFHATGQERRSSYQRQSCAFPQPVARTETAQEFGGSKTQSLYEATNSSSWISQGSGSRSYMGGRYGKSFHRSGRLGAHDDPRKATSMFHGDVMGRGHHDDVNSSLASSSSDEDDRLESDIPEPERLVTMEE